MKDTRICKTCEQELSISDFKVTHRKVTPSHPAGMYYTRDCKSCLNAKRRADRAANKERERNYRIRDFCKKLGYTQDQTKSIQEFFKGHDGCCDICGYRSDETLHIDHCHKTNAIRGLLCRNCNLMLGHAFDRYDILLSGAAYLKHKHAWTAYPNSTLRPDPPKELNDPTWQDNPNTWDFPLYLSRKI